jgi:nicotinamide mononucleotide (NMN) deamidase PncC
MYFSSNVAQIDSEAAGTAANYILRLRSIKGSSVSYINLARGGSPTMQFYTNSSTLTTMAQYDYDNMTGTSGTQYVLVIDPTVAQSSTAGYTALKLNVTESSTGSGNKRLIEGDVASSNKFYIDNAGNAYFAGSVTSTSVQSYGSMYWATSEEVTVGAADTWYEVNPTTTGSVSGVTFANGDLTVGSAGLWWIGWTVSTAAATATETFEVSISVNDTVQDPICTISRKYSSADVGASAGQCLLSLAANDVVKLEVLNDDAAHNITFLHGNITIRKF